MKLLAFAVLVPLLAVLVGCASLPAPSPAQVITVEAVELPLIQVAKAAYEWPAACHTACDGEVFAIIINVVDLRCICLMANAFHRHPHAPDPAPAAPEIP